MQVPQFVDNYKNESAEALSPWFLADWLVVSSFQLCCVHPFLLGVFFSDGVVMQWCVVGRHKQPAWLLAYWRTATADNRHSMVLHHL